jgi:hypothetical protein
MKVVTLNGHVFDLEELTLIAPERTSLLLTFKNGDRIELTWRDSTEQAEICHVLGFPHKAHA